MKKCIGLISANYTSSGMGSLVKDRSLAAVPFAGRYRFIDFPLSNMVNSGINTIALVTPSNSRSLLEHIGTGKAWGIGRKASSLYLLPGSVTGARLEVSRFLMRDLERNISFFEFDEAKFVILSATSKVFSYDFNELIKFQEEHDFDITFLYKKMEFDGQKNLMNIEMDESGRITKISNGAVGEGNCFLDTIIMKRDYLLEFIKWYGVLESMDVAEIVMENTKRLKVGGCEFKGYVGIVNDINDYMRVSKDMINNDIRKEVFVDRTVFTNVQDKFPTYYGKDATVKSSIIAAGSKIEGNVENSIVFRTAKIGKGAIVKNCVLMQYCEIGEGAHLENVICDKYVKISAGVTLSGTDETPLVIDKNSKL